MSLWERKNLRLQEKQQEYGQLNEDFGAYCSGLTHGLAYMMTRGVKV